MPRIDPQQLLSCLGVLLNSNGGIRSKDEVARLASLMTKYSKNLVSKCVYILILKNTDTELLGRFMSAGGWNLTHVWLTNGIMNKNWALVGELLELMLMCPVDVERLKANNCPKLVKGLSKEGGPEGVRVLASKLVEQWLKVVKGETQPSSALNATTFVATNTLPPQSSIEITSTSSIDPLSTTRVETQESQNENVEVVEATAFETTVTTQESVVNDNNSTADTSSVGHTDQPAEQNAEVDSAPVYRLTFRDGKQVIAKVDDSTDGTTVDSKTEKEKEKEKEKSTSSSNSSSSSRDKDKKHLSKHSSKSSSSSSSSSRRSSSSSHKDKSRDKDRDRDRDKDKDRDRRDREKSRHKSNGTSSSSSSTSKSSSSSSKDNKEKQAEKDKATLAKLQPLSLSKLGKIPKKTSDDDKKDKKTIADPPPKVEVKKPSISIENRKHSAESRPKTVKIFNAKMRSTGLEEEVKPPPPRPVQRKIPPPKRTSPPKDIMKDHNLSPTPEKRAKIVDMLNGDVERPGGIKLIAPKPKPVGLQECGLFMDAMVAASTKKDTKKRKRRMSVTKEDNAPGGKSSSPPHSPSTGSIKAEKAASSPTQLQLTAPKFYKDTLELNEDADVKTENVDDQKDSENASESKMESSENKEKDVKAENSKTTEDFAESLDIKLNESADTPRLKDEFKIPGGVLVYHKRAGPKKSVKWKDDSHLEEIQYFELDENERTNVTKTFMDMKQIEMCGEREALQMSRKLPNEDLMDERTRWRPLIPIDLAPDLAVLGKKSKEKDIQYAREKVILQALYFHKSMIPDSPTEPDVEHHPMDDPTIIPLDDVAGNPDNIKDFTAIPWPEPKAELPRAQAPPPVSQFPSIQPNFLNVAGGPNTFPPFANQTNFMGEPPILTGDWRTGDGRVMGMSNDMGPIPPPPNLFGPPMGGMPPPNLFHGPGPDGFNMMPNMNNMNGPFPPGPPVNFQGGPGMFNDGGNGFQGNRGGGGNMRGRGRGGFDRFNNGPPNNWKGGGGGGGKNWMNRGICKHFQKGGYCRQGDKCQFLHPGLNCPPF